MTSPNIWLPLEAFLKCPFLIQSVAANFWPSFGKFGQLFIPTSGHTENDRHAGSIFVSARSTRWVGYTAQIRSSRHISRHRKRRCGFPEWASPSKNSRRKLYSPSYTFLAFLTFYTSQTFESRLKMLMMWPSNLLELVWCTQFVNFVKISKNA